MRSKVSGVVFNSVYIRFSRILVNLEKMAGRQI